MIRSVLYKLYLQIWYVVIRVLLDTSNRYEVVGRIAVLPTSSGAFYKLYLQIWYVVICVLLGSFSRYFVPAGRVEQYAYHHIPNLQIQLVKRS